MSAQAWEPRVSRLEGAFEQLPDRLNSMDVHLERLESKIEGDLGRLESRIEGNLGRLETKIDGRLGRLESKVDSNFKALIGWTLGQTVVVVGAVSAVAFVLHR